MDQSFYKCNQVKMALNTFILFTQNITNLYIKEQFFVGESNGPE